MPATLSPVQAALTNFQAQPGFRASATNFFQALGYESNRVVRLDKPTAAGFQQHFSLTPDQFNATKAHTGEWQQFEFLFQFGEKEARRATQGDSSLDLFEQGENKGDKNSFFFHAVKLKKDSYRRGVLADITRQLNRPFGLPTVVMFEHGDCVSLGVINRRLSKSKKAKEQGQDVLEKVTLIKDIDLKKPHPAHLRILDELRLSNQAAVRDVTNFDTLLNGWRATLSVTELNKRFYRELANWYFWALQHVEFPVAPGSEAGTRHHQAVIRLITRLIFVWFLREKKLVPAALFNKKALDKLLNYQDKTSSTYYKAILQNLFFATLNAEMNPADKAKPRNRRFITDQDAQDKGYFVHSLYRYERFFADKAAALALFENVPFLNGGLFECLDRKKVGQPASRIDCFSDNPKNEKRLTVPDFLFFDEQEHDIDLNETYDTKRRKYKVRGLLAILNSYKFTVTENTPVEEEVALDPELLGKVFENLLASYNPETKTTARKQTGSFYTPREVVDYMVDESLIAYLGTALTPPADAAPASPASFVEIGHQQTNMFANEGKKQAALHLEAAPAVAAPAAAPRPAPELTQRLRHLLAYNNDAPAFDSAEKLALLSALHRCRILDPACGSGAYPMGILHKMVFVLNRLDPENKHWQELQKQQAMQDFNEAADIADEQKREARLLEINRVFQENLHDYTRKLFLIENCIYGVDLQPIAVQISKLRFFISLVVDQKPNDAKPNRGIRPLPNLETKFVAANSLISLDEKFKGLFGHDDPEIKELEKELKKARHQHFLARTWEAKKKARDRDETLREQLVKLIELRAAQHEARVTAKIAELDGYIQTTVQQLANKATAGDQAKRQKSLELLRRTRATEQAKHLDQESVKDNVSQVGRWDPYDQNTWAAFFDTEWMFGEEVKDGFHIVIGNPPYVRQEKFTALKLILQKFYPNSYDGKADLYVYFYDRALQLLQPNGVLCLITANKFFMGGYGQKLRTLLATTTSFSHLLDFGDAPVFDAIAYPTIILTCKQTPNIGHRLQAFLWKPGPEIETFTAVFEDHSASLPQKALATDGWRLDDTSEEPLLARLRAKNKTLDEYVGGEAYYGMKPGSARFFIDEETRTDLIKKDQKSAEIIKPVLMGRDLKPYSKAMPGRYLLFARRGIEINKYPAVLEYLEYFKQELLPKPRDWSGKEWLGRKAGTYAWYELQDAIDYYKMFERPKIMYQKFQVKPCFVYDESGLYCNDSMWILPNASKYLLGLLNSRMGWYLISQFCTRIQNGYQLIYQYLRQIPIAIPSATQEKQIETLVNQILATKAALVTADTSELEGKIDRLIYHLYKLTYDEVLLIEPAFSQLETEYNAAANSWV